MQNTIQKAIANAEKRLKEMKKSIDKRTNGFKNRIAATMRKPDAAMEMIRSALNAGIPADYILMDTWFTNEPFIQNVLDVGLDVIGMLKDNKQMYHYKGKLVNLKQLAAHFVRFDTPNDLFGSVSVRTRKHHIPVKLVFVRNRNKKDEYIIILSTDCSLSDSEIVRRYGCRWSIECCYKVCKSLLKLGKEFQPVFIQKLCYQSMAEAGMISAELKMEESFIMKATGIVRRMDEHGRIVVQKEIRWTLRSREGALSLTTLAERGKGSDCVGLRGFQERKRDVFVNGIVGVA